MNELPTILTERIDDIPLLLEPRQRRGLPTLVDTHFPTHGNGTGRSLGWVSPLWLSAIVSRGAHRRGHVEPWVATRLWTLGVTPGQAVTRGDFTDARRAVVRRRLRHAERWGAFASALPPHTVRVDDRLTQRGHGAFAAALEAMGRGAPPSAGWCGRAHRVHGSGVPRALRLPWGCASRWASRCPMGQRGVWWGERGGRHTRRRWRFAPGWPKRWRRLRRSTTAVAAKSGLRRWQLSGRRGRGRSSA